VYPGVRPSRADPGARQPDRLLALGLAVAPLPPRRDVDQFDDALAVARQAPHTAFAAALAAMAVGAS
jgi:hypothetical protein